MLQFHEVLNSEKIAITKMALYVKSSVMGFIQENKYDYSVVSY